MTTWIQAERQLANNNLAKSSENKEINACNMKSAVNIKFVA